MCGLLGITLPGSREARVTQTVAAAFDPRHLLFRPRFVTLTNRYCERHDQPQRLLGTVLKDTEIGSDHQRANRRNGKYAARGAIVFVATAEAYISAGARCLNTRIGVQFNTVGVKLWITHHHRHARQHRLYRLQIRSSRCSCLVQYRQLDPIRRG